ncbi:MAG: SMI1/KNR4 family protein [Roseiflexaceae bacterium]
MYQEIEQRYQFVIPPLYRSLQHQGWLDPANLAGQALLDSHYLWLFDVEWWSLDQIRDYAYPSYYQPGFVPFASTDTGDFWCWWPERATDAGAPVVLCPHDSIFAHIDAPHFEGWIYRRVLTYAAFLPAAEQEGRAWLTRWAQVLGTMLPAAWRATILNLAHTPLKTWEDAITHEPGTSLLTPDEYAALVQRDIDCSGRDAEFRWMR